MKLETTFDVGQEVWEKNQSGLWQELRRVYDMSIHGVRKPEIELLYLLEGDEQRGLMTWPESLSATPWPDLPTKEEYLAANPPKRRLHIEVPQKLIEQYGEVSDYELMKRIEAVLAGVDWEKEN